ncbi:SusC/RagA family TonB-linked outer membrane protein [Larkinella arboricola]
MKESLLLTIRKYIPFSLLMMCLLLLGTGQSQAQSKKVSGVVTDETAEAMVGVSVAIKGTTKGTITDVNGAYSLDVGSPNDVLVFSMIGYVSQEIQVGNRSTIDLSLATDTKTLSEVVVTGYQSQKKSDLTGSVAVVDMVKTKDIPSGSALQNIQGRVPGLYIQSDGAPSGAARSVMIRGQNTLGNTNPLYIIDGVPTTDPNIFQFMDPNSIESMQILKDASAASIYGSRASNGVIIVTTKSGKDKVNISFNSSISASSYSRRIPMMNTQQLGRTLWQASVNDGTPTTAHSARYTFEEHTDANGVRVLDRVIPTPFVNGDPNIPSADTDWQKEIFKTGIVSQNNITISAGNPRSSTLISLSYFTNSGLVINNSYKRYNARINNSVNFFNARLKIGENLQIIKASEHPMGGDQYGLAGWNADGTTRLAPVGSNPIQLATTMQPLLPVRKLDGTFAGPIGAGFSDRMNGVFLADLDKNDVNNDLQTFGNIYAELTPIDNLVLRTSFGVDYTNNYDVNYERKYSHGFINRTINNMSVAQRHRVNWTWSNTANYSLDLGKKRFNFLAGMEAIRNHTQVFQTLKQGFALEEVDYFQLSAGTGIATNSGFATENKLLSYFGKVNYAHDDRYLLSATLRYDGSSRFGENNKFGIFPAVSAGWNISNEEFIKKGATIISNLKLRAGIGRVGNQEIGDYVRFQQFATNYGTTDPSATTRSNGSAYDINGANTGALLSGYVATRTANPNLKWETTDEMNLGLDFGFLNQKLIGSFDYFTRKTRDILITPTTVGAIGEGAVQTVNGATMDNSGFELSLGYADQKGDFTYSIDGNVSRFKDKITYLPSTVVRSYAGNVEKTILGHSRTSVFGYIADGLFQSTEEVTAHAVQPGKGVGRIRYKDLNGDGVIDALDQDWLGTELPGFTYGLNTQLGYKGFTLSIFMRGVSNIMVNDANKSFTDFMGTNTGVAKGARLLNAWTPQNTSSPIPAASLVNNNSETRTSTYLRVRGDYFKVQNIQLGYSLPGATVQRMRLSALRIYTSADNAILIFKKSGENAFTGADPETPGSIFPRPVRFTLGIDAKF